jgi:uncharacterized membrane protein (UPF0127 family)
MTGSPKTQTRTHAGFGALATTRILPPARKAAQISIFLLLFLIGCNEQSPSGMTTVKMQLGNKNFTLEVADRDGTRAYGLKRRDSMPDDHGMIFVFDHPQELRFWMEDTRIPLDIVYIDSTGHVVSVKQMKPFDRETTPSDGLAQYAVELNKGAAEAAGVKPGMALKIPEGVKSKD